MHWLGYLGLVGCLAVASTPPLSISLETSWSAPPLVLEILETVYDESPASYFPFLRLLTAHTSPSDRLSPRETLETALDLLSSHDLLPNPSSLSTLNCALGLHTAAPRIEAFYNWYEGSIDESRLGVEGCGSWVEWRGKGFCEVEGLKADIELSLEEAQHHENDHPALLPFDHISRSASSSNPIAVFYYDPSASGSTALLNYLLSHSAVDINFSYLVRYKPNRSPETRHTPMSGYGVELALKRTDYLVVDDRATGPAGNRVVDGDRDSSVAPGTFSEILGPDPWSELATPLTPEEIHELGLKAATLIMNSSNKLDALVHLTQDFPKYSAALARNVNVSNAISESVVDMFRRSAPATGIYINGKLFTDVELNAYSLLKAIRTERDLALSLIDLGLTSEQSYRLISDPVIGRQQTEDDPGEGVVDASDRAEGGNVIIWWNNIEKDTRYKKWSSDVSGYLRPLYPGQLHTVRRNTFNTIFVLDLALTTSLEIMNEQVIGMIKGNIPLRFGVVPMFDAEINDASLAMAKLLPYSIKTFGRGYTQELLIKIIQGTPSTAASPGVVTLETLKSAFEITGEESGKEHIPFEELVGPEYDKESIEAIRRYTTRLAATKAESALGHVFLNGKYFPANAQWMQFVQGELMTQLNFVQQQLMAGSVDYNHISTLFYDLPSTSLRRNKLIIPNVMDNKLKITPLDTIFASARAKLLTEQMMYPAGEVRDTTISMWIIGDLNSVETRKLVDDAVANLETGRTAARLGFIHVPKEGSSASVGFSYFVYTALKAGQLGKLGPEGFRTLAKGNDAQCEDADGSMACFTWWEQRDEDGNTIGEHEPPENLISNEEAAEFWKVGTEIAEILGFKSQHPHILINGRLIGPVTSGSFQKDDFAALEAYEQRKRVKSVYDLVRTMVDASSFDRSAVANLVSTASSVIASAYAASDDGIFTPMPVARSRDYEMLDEALSFSIGDSNNAILHVAAVLDPVSEAAQSASFLLQTLAQMGGVAISVYLTPVPLMAEVTLKRFYRFALSPKLEFDVDGNDISPQITFNDLPAQPLFTLAMDTPPAWIVSPRHSPFDLDNLVLGSARDPVHVSMNLKQLVIEGHARESNNAPPRGLQLQLTTQGLAIASDTQVMANLGYMQFKATPGVYHLAIRPGRGTEVYELESVGNDGWDSAGINVTGTRVALASFDGMTILPRFTRKKGMEMANVLIEDLVVPQSYPQAVFTRMKQIIGVIPPPRSVVTVKHADINIFTVASGLLYERFASIMILSVMKNTKSSVKFWFIENFLSPEFLEFLPKMADEYGFQYEFVTYKWPHWLRAQTEKQRIIWAYKILFLDVLFPMDLDKVIFVDADQIVRVDMKELVGVDLHGNVYGYPPMGNSREEMEGFRFWKTGYWRDALRGRPYHISALYVVDLKRFRQLATGDRLRGQYHALSADPNSLANLDQDLPNSMQDQIPIFTLEQDWLWCQTWCDDESLKTAKTIDLCQNPLTKEPKLVRARQIPEWDSYDQEIAAFAARISGDTGLAASVDDLAGGPAPAIGATDVVEEQAPVEDHEAEALGEAHRRRIDDEL